MRVGSWWGGRERTTRGCGRGGGSRCWWWCGGLEGWMRMKSGDQALNTRAHESAAGNGGRHPGRERESCERRLAAAFGRRLRRLPFPAPLRLSLSSAPPSVSLSLSVLVLLVALFFGPAVCLSTLRKLLEILPATVIAMVWAVVAPLRARAVGTNDENHSGYLDVVGAAIRCSLFVSGDEYE